MRNKVEAFSQRLIKWIGSYQSVVAHTILFTLFFSLRLFGVTFSEVLSILTNVVSLEAIYLSIFIQMTINKHSTDLEEVSEDIDEIHGKMPK